MKPGQLQALEEAVNEKIRAHVPVTVQLLSIDDPAVEKVYTRIVFGAKIQSYCVIKSQGFIISTHLLSLQYLLT